MQDFFGPVIHCYTRAEAITDGTLIDLSRNYPDQCSIYRHPVACTAAVWCLIEQGAGNNNGTSHSGIVWDILYMSQHGVVARPNDQTVLFEVIVSVRGCSGRHRLKAMCHPGDHQEPVITIMLPGED